MKGKEIVEANKLYFELQKFAGGHSTLRENNNSIVIAYILKKLIDIEKMLKNKQ